MILSQSRWTDTFGRSGCDFSFSGLKTAVRHKAAALNRDETGALGDQDRADLAASFQAAVADVLADRCENALARFRAEGAAGPLVVAGGVAANQNLRSRLTNVAAVAGTCLIAPPPELCTDNAAMIAWAGIERLSLQLTDPLDFAPRPRWPLEDLKRQEAAR